uniref:Ribonuclease H-like domain-containing protein n=1 Tax=Tanacetum cinerariifolium TaxID=118510 RepID=A0A699HJS6_TANCI|nr:ribonuclease H-like domain-containing protein [Tanacetum cinerariifolium]
MFLSTSGACRLLLLVVVGVVEIVGWIVVGKKLLGLVVGKCGPGKHLQKVQSQRSSSIIYQLNNVGVVVIGDGLLKAVVVLAVENSEVLASENDSNGLRKKTRVFSSFYMKGVGSIIYNEFRREQVCLYMHDPREPRLLALKRILRYIRGNIDHGLQLHASSMTQLVAYTNADWTCCPVTRRSTSGYCVCLGDNLLSWSAKRHVTLSHSSVEAEYHGVASVVAETPWIRNLLRELHTPLFTANLVCCDNVSAVYLSTNPVQHQRTKHIEIDIYFVRDYVDSGQVRVLHVPSRFNFADIFTKGLHTALFIDFHSSLNIRRPPAQAAREY